MHYFMPIIIAIIIIEKYVYNSLNNSEFKFKIFSILNGYYILGIEYKAY